MKCKKFMNKYIILFICLTFNYYLYSNNIDSYNIYYDSSIIEDTNRFEEYILNNNESFGYNFFITNMGLINNIIYINIKDYRIIYQQYKIVDTNLILYSNHSDTFEYSLDSISNIFNNGYYQILSKTFHNNEYVKTISFYDNKNITSRLVLGYVPYCNYYLPKIEQFKKLFSFLTSVEVKYEPSCQPRIIKNTTITRKQY